MNVKIEKFDSGWMGISLALGKEEIELFVRRLNKLKAGEIGHFHFRNENFGPDEGVADIEITTIGKDDVDNMVIS
jgi:hypothetical protein